MPSRRQTERAGKFANGGPVGNQKAKGNPGGGRIDGIYNPKYHPQKAHNQILLDVDTTDALLAAIFDISLNTLNKWKQRYPEFRTAIDSARDSDGKVSRSLTKVARGYHKKSEQVKFEKDLPCPDCVEKGNTKCEHCAGTMTGRIVRIRTRKYYPPSVDAAKFVLTNRRPDKWRRNDPVDVVDNSTGESINVDDLPLELRKQLFEHMQQAKSNRNKK